MEHPAHDPFHLDRLLPEAIAFALKVPDPKEFRAWAYYRLPKIMEPHLHESILGSTPLAQYQFCINFAQFLWNAIPFPDNNFQPRPMPVPRGNAPCWCHSGLTFGQCCGQPTTTPMPQMPPEVLYAFVLLELPEKRLRNSDIRFRLPFSSIAGAACEFMERREYRKTVALLESHFNDVLLCWDEDAAYVLNILCDALDALEQRAKKERILVHVANCVPGSPANLAALQRLATMEMDRGRPDRAWKFFDTILQTDQQGVDAAALETHLLMAERRFKEAKERAAFWLRKLRDLEGNAKEGGVFDFLREVANDPLELTGAIVGQRGGEAMSLLGRLIARLSHQPLPTYHLAEQGFGSEKPSESMRDQFERQLRAMGVAQEQISDMAAEMETKVHELAAARPDDKEETAEEEWVDDPELPTFTLSPPGGLWKLQRQWELAFHAPKPSLTNVAVMGELNPWEPEIMRAWVSFLEQHPEAFDHFSVLDDLLNALALHPETGNKWFDAAFNRPLMNRARDILLKAVEGMDPTPNVPWVILDNRPALRCLFRAMLAHHELGEGQEALRLMECLLKLNPGDNHGVRALAVNLLLREGRNEDALEIANRYYEGDHMADVQYGRVLALYRLGHMEEARDALEDAQGTLPLIPKYLLATRPKEPEMSPFGVTIGGKAQAWSYREEMLDVWKATPGALAWLKSKGRG